MTTQPKDANDGENGTATPATNPALVASVVIPVRGRSIDLGKCLDRLAQQTLERDRFEILVCDDGSDSADAERIRDLCRRHENVRCLRQPPRGPAAARNLGVAHAQAEIVAFTDSDTLPEPQWLATLLEPFVDESVIASEGPVRTPRPAQSPLEEAPRNEGGVHLTANMAYRRGSLLAVGGLDEAFPLAAFEDTDLALSLRDHGRFAWASDAVVIHPWRRITLASSIRRIRQLDWLLVTALRHGCLGWESRPTRHPRLRVALAAAVTLPIGRVRMGVRSLARRPVDGCARVAIAFVEALVGLALAPRWLCFATPKARGRYLDGANR